MEKHAKVNGNIMIGLTEKIEFVSNNGDNEQVVAKIDTGATRSSIDIKFASKLNLGPVIKSKMVKSASGNKLRPVIEAEIIIAGKKIKSEFTLADRKHMKYPVLIGVNVLKSGNCVDLYEVKCSHRIVKAKKQLERMKRLMNLSKSRSFFYCGSSGVLVGI